MQRRDFVIGLFRSTPRALEAVDALRVAGFAGGDVSVVGPDARGAGPDATAEEGAAATGAVTGGVLGGLAGWLVGVGALAIPGVGPLLAAGAFASAAAGAAIGVGLGAVGGVLVEMGMSEEEAGWYERQVHAGGTLVTVRADGRYDEAQSILRQHGAVEAEIHGQVTGEPPAR